MDNNITELVSYYDIFFKKYSWYFYDNEEWYTYINIKDGVITNLKKSEKDLFIFLKKKSFQIVNSTAYNIDKKDKLRLNKLINNEFKDVVNLIDDKKIESELYETYVKKVEKKYEDKCFNEIYESTRKERQKENLDLTISVMEKILNKRIDFDDKEVWDSLRNGIERYSEQNDTHPYEYLKRLLGEYSTGSILSAKNIVLSLCKDASRQNLSEELQKNIWFENGINLRGLPQSGDDTIHIFNDKWVRGKELTIDTKGIATKAMDFKIIDSKGEVYTYNKYNKWVGGSTDDVYNDIKKTIESFNKIKDNTTKLLIILDGKYWDDGKRNELSIYNNNLLMITCSDKSGDESVKDFIF
jgi:hypothetical protein